MIWCKIFTLLAFVLVLTVSSNALSQDKKTTVAAEAPQDEDTIDLTPPAVLSTEKDEDERGAGQIVGQSLVPQLLGQSILPRPLNLFSAMFPALNSLLLMGNLFPAASLLGTPSLLGSTHQLGPAQNDEVPADSKVVLVLAEDRNPHAAMRAAHQEAARTIRQNDMFSQLLAQFGQADFGQMLSQSLEQIQQQNANPLLQQFVPQELSQTMGQLLSQTFQQFPGLDLSQFPMLGQPPPSADPSANSALPEGEGEAAASAGDAAPPTPGFQFPNFQSAIDAGTQLLGQAFQQPTGDPSSGFQLPNFQSAFDASSQMLGQALQQANGDAVNGFQLPNFQSVIDTGNQMLTQSGGLFNLRPLQSLDTSASASDAEPAASQISEVRVKPDIISSDDSTAHEMQKDVNMDEFKMTSALQKALLHKKLPILWFRIPTDSLEKDHDLETTPNASKLKNVDEKQLQTKLQAFQRQVITELKLLQDIERQAKEMRAASMGATSKTLKDNANDQSSMLSKIPIHKITRSDIEKALNDDYVKKLLHKAAIANRKEAGKTTIYTPSGGNIKRQTSKSKITPRQMTRDDIVRMMAYAYRMANANGIRMLESPESKKPSSNPESDGNQASGNTSKATERKWPSGAKASMERQWLDEERQIPDAKTFQQDPTLMHAGRQMQQNMGRQWLDEQKPTHTIQPQVQPILEHHRQALEDNPKMNSQRQWVDHKSDMLNWMQENSQMPMQRQWADKPSMPPMPSQTADGRMWAEQQPQVAMQQPMMMPQMPMPMIQQPQMVAQQIPMDVQQLPMQQPQMVAQQIPMEMQQMPMQQPQMVAQQIPMEMQQMPMQQPQMVAQHTPMELQHMQMQQPQMVAQQIPMEMQQMPMQQPQMVAQHTPMELQHMPMMMQQPQMVAQHTPMGQMPMLMQQPRMGMQEPPMLMQHRPMMTQQPQGELQQMGAQGDTMMLQQMSPDMQRQTHEQDIVGEAMPQMPENSGKARFKGGSLFDELDMFGLGGGDKKKKLKEPKPALRPTIINYYYYDHHRPATYGSGGYSGGSVSYGSSSKPSYGASYGGGYGGSVPSYGASAGASYSSAGYAAPSTGSYRTAVGDDEIMALLQENTHMKMMSDSDRNPVTKAVVPTTTTYQTTTMATEDNKQKHLPLQTETSSISHKPNSTTTTTTITSTVIPPTTTSSKLSSSSVNPMDPENVGSFFSFSPSILTPFMELQSVPLYESDPWNHKSFDLHYPLYEGGGSYEPYLNSKRLKRKTYSYTNNILTPSILEHFLKVRVQFEKSFPQLYKSLRDQQRALNLTRVYVKPPVIPKEVMYPPTELGAAELLQLDLSSTQIIEPKAKSEDVIDYVLFDDDD